MHNQLDAWTMRDEQLVATYGKTHTAWRAKHAFSWLKSGAAINPMFLESPRPSKCCASGCWLVADTPASA